MSSSPRVVWTCASCLRAQRRNSSIAALHSTKQHVRQLQSATRLHNGHHAAQRPASEAQDGGNDEEKGALSRRLSEMAEETMTTGSKSDRNIMADAGFSDDLKRQLEERIAQSAFRSQNLQAYTEMTMPAAAGKGTREQAAAEPWTGTESLHDSALRMLDDSHKKIRTPSRIPKPAVSFRPSPKQKNISPADRLANARDKTSIYALSQQSDMTEDERAKMRQELKERFTPGARPAPATLQGLTSLANERIEDAIARGQFKNIQRGKGVNIERDYAANSPFLDTTEYFMNKLIQKQEIVPPWIEKQQELVKLVTTFRSRLRHDWRRHAARMISAEGGSIAQQVEKARSYALTEQEVNPIQPKRESVTRIDSTGNLQTITVEEKVAAGIAPDTSQPDVSVQVTESVIDGNDKSEENQTKIIGEISLQPDSIHGDPAALPPQSSASTSRVLPMPYPFRDPEWEHTESAYHNLAIAEINSLARSYNLMAPKVAQKPYHSLTRELNRCYAEVAPQLADEILERSRKPKLKVEVLGHREGSVMAKFQGSGHVSKVRDEDSTKGYGLKQFWRDLFRKDERVGSRRGSMV